MNALAPGYIATDMTLQGRQRPELFNVWLDMTPMGRLGEPSEVPPRWSTWRPQRRPT